MSTLMDQARNHVPRIAEAAVERARLRVVPRSTSRRTTRVPFMALVSLLMVGGVAGLLFLNTSMQQTSFTATALEGRAEQLDAQRQGLQMELDALRDPQRLAVEASAMGMVPNTSPAFVRLQDGTVLGTPAPASAANSLRVTPLPTRKPKNLTPKPLFITRAGPASGSRAHGDNSPQLGAAAAPAQAATGTTGSRNRQHGSQR